MRLTVYRDSIPDSCYRWSARPTPIHQGISHPVFVTIINPDYDEHSTRSSGRGKWLWGFAGQPWYRKRALEFEQRRGIRLVRMEQGEEQEQPQPQKHVGEHGLWKRGREFVSHWKKRIKRIIELTCRLHISFFTRASRTFSSFTLYCRFWESVVFVGTGGKFSYERTMVVRSITKGPGAHYETSCQRAVRETFSDKLSD